MLTVADQALVSGCNFFVNILLVRTLGLEDYGIYVLLYAALQYLNTFSAAIIVSPMMSLVPTLADDLAKRRILRGAFGWQLLLSLLLGAIAFLGCKAWHLANENWAGAVAITPFTCAVIAFQLQDWFRRYHFVTQRPARAFRADTLAYGGMLVAMTIAALAGRLDVSYAFSILSGLFALAVLIDFFFERTVPYDKALRDAYLLGRRAARDYLLAWQLTWAGNQGILFLGAVSIGAEGAGAVRATQTLLGPLNVAFHALDNFLPVRAGVIYRQFGTKALSIKLRTTFFQLALPLTAIMLLLGLFAKPLVEIIYGISFEALAVLVLWQCLYFSLQYCLRFLHVFHRTLNSTSVIVQSSLLAAAMALLTSVPFVTLWSEAGVVAAWCLSTMASILFLGWRSHLTLLKDRK